MATNPDRDVLTTYFGVYSKDIPIHPPIILIICISLEYIKKEEAYNKIDALIPWIYIVFFTLDETSPRLKCPRNLLSNYSVTSQYRG